MKTFRILFFFLSAIAISTAVMAQEKTEKIKVWGECGMCKSKIEKAAKEAGAASAEWDADSKELAVSYNSTSTNTAKIEKAVAAVGYDTKNVKATDEAYNKLHACCKYERPEAAAKTEASCCKDGKCTDCCKDGKCTHGADCCKDGKCDKAMDCCKDGKCEHKGDKAHACGKKA